MPTGYGDPMAEYWRLINGGAMWDVSVERQVELVGPDAARLAQILTPRKLDALRPGVGRYVPICDHRGVIINDPILLKIADDRFWLSIADSDIVLFARALAAERKLNVRVFEPDVSPLAIQGPKADDVVGDLLGEDILSLKFFHFRDVDLDGIPLTVARSGWSHQGGFEFYLLDGSKGDALWAKVKEAGQPYGIGPGTPNPMERVESGLLSYGGDTDDETNPFEVRLGRYVDLDAPDEVLSIEALREIHAKGVTRHQVGVKLAIDGQYGQTDRLSTVLKGNAEVGKITAHAYSPRLECNIGIALISNQVTVGEEIDVALGDGRSTAGVVCDLPFI